MASAAHSQGLRHAIDTPLKIQRKEYISEQLREDRLPSSYACCAHRAGGCGDGYRDSPPPNHEVGTQTERKGGAQRIRGVEHRSLHKEEAELDETEPTGKSSRTDACRNFTNALSDEFEFKGREEDDEETATSELEEKDDREKPTPCEDDVTSLRLESQSRQTWNSRHTDGAPRLVDGPKLAWGSPGTERKVRITIIRSKKAHGDSAKAISSTGSEISSSPTSVKGERRPSDAVQKEETCLPHTTTDRKKNSCGPDLKQTHQCRRSGEDGKTAPSQTTETVPEEGTGKQIQAESKSQVASSAETPVLNTAARLQGSGDQPGCPSAESKQSAKKNDDLLNTISRTYKQTSICSNNQSIKFKPKGIFSKWVGHTKRALKLKSAKQNGLVFKVSQDARPSAPDNSEAEPPANEPTKTCPSPQPVSKRPERNLTEMFAARPSKQTLTHPESTTT